MGDGAKDSGASVFVQSREQLMRWYHVDGMKGRALQDKYRQECGVFAEVANLEKWLLAPVQRLAALETNLEMHGHACGEYALLELQKGRSVSVVVAELREKYLVETSEMRLKAYRKYREQRSEYWTVEKLEHDHWQDQ